MAIYYLFDAFFCTYAQLYIIQDEQIGMLSYSLGTEFLTSCTKQECRGRQPFAGVWGVFQFSPLLRRRRRQKRLLSSPVSRKTEICPKGRNMIYLK